MDAEPAAAAQPADDLPQIIVHDGRSYLRTPFQPHTRRLLAEAGDIYYHIENDFRVYENGELHKWKKRTELKPEPELGFPEPYIVTYEGHYMWPDYRVLGRYHTAEDIPTYLQYNELTEPLLEEAFSALPVVVCTLAGDSYTAPAGADGATFRDRLASSNPAALASTLLWCVIDSEREVEIATDHDLRRFVQRGGDPTAGDGTLMLAFRPQGDDGLPMVYVDASTGNVFLRTAAGEDLYTKYTGDTRADLAAIAEQLDYPDTLAVGRIDGRGIGADAAAGGAAGGTAAAFVDAAAVVN